MPMSNFLIQQDRPEKESEGYCKLCKFVVQDQWGFPNHHIRKKYVKNKRNRYFSGEKFILIEHMVIRHQRLEQNRCKKFLKITFINRYKTSPAVRCSGIKNRGCVRNLNLS